MIEKKIKNWEIKLISHAEEFQVIYVHKLYKFMVEQNFPLFNFRLHIVIFFQKESKRSIKRREKKSNFTLKKE